MPWLLDIVGENSNYRAFPLDLDVARLIPECRRDTLIAADRHSTVFGRLIASIPYDPDATGEKQGADDESLFHSIPS